MMIGVSGSIWWILFMASSQFAPGIAKSVIIKSKEVSCSKIEKISV